MKRFIAVLVILLCVVSLASCDINKYFDPKDTSDVSTSTTETTETTGTQSLPNNTAAKLYNTALNELNSDNVLQKIEFYQAMGVSQDPEFDKTASGYYIIDGENLLVYKRSNGSELMVTVIGNTVYETLTQNGNVETTTQEYSSDKITEIKTQLLSFLSLILKLDDKVLDGIEMESNGFSLKPDKSCYTDFINTQPEITGFAPASYLVYLNDDGSFKQVTNTIYCVLKSSPNVMTIQSVTLNFVDGATHIAPPTQD